MVIELWGGPQDGAFVEMPNLPPELHLPMAPDLSAVRAAEDADDDLYHPVGVYERTSVLNGDGDYLYRWIGVH